MTLLEAFHIEAGDVLESDICIIGGGAAGIAIACEFIGTKYTVLLLESGGFYQDPKTQSLNDVENIGHPLRVEKGYVSRNRYFGGSTNTWAGRCMPLNPIDFEKREWVKDSGWPFDREELEPFYRKAAQVLQLPDFNNFNPTIWQSRMLKQKAGFLFGDEVAVPEVSLFGRSPLKMRTAYGPELNRAPNIQICLHANVVEIEPDPGLNSVNRIHAMSLQRNHFFIRSKFYILACGGWENARLLLLSRRYTSAGLGNTYDVVGRYYMEHPKIDLGRIYPGSNMLKSPIFLDLHAITGGYAQLGIRLTDQIQHQKQLLNHYIELFPHYPEGMPEAYQHLQWFGYHLKRFRWAKINCENIEKFLPHLGNISNYLIRRRFNLAIPYSYISIRNHFEQTPNRDSRVTLSREHDALGLQRLKVNLHISEQDKHNLIRLHKLLSHHVQQHGIGQWVGHLPDSHAAWAGLTDSSHHMGTTRMSDSPYNGVVDRHCKVHGLSNLYISSSSVFPTGGHANPTLTIIALALRLANHLKVTALPIATSAITKLIYGIPNSANPSWRSTLGNPK